MTTLSNPFVLAFAAYLVPMLTAQGIAAWAKSRKARAAAAC